jgi:hypothetical protein
MLIDAWLLDILACPQCHAPLRADEDASELVCTSQECGLAYPVRGQDEFRPAPVVQALAHACSPGRRASSTSRTGISSRTG